MKKDLGLFLKQNYSQILTHHFYDVKFYGIDRISENLYSTMLETTFNGEVFALSFDYDKKILENILSLATNARELKKEVKEIEVGGFLNLKEPITIPAITASLGNLQHAKKESFIPLVIEEISV